LVILICRLVLDRNLLLSWLVWEQALSIYPKPEEGLDHRRLEILDWDGW
jgi:hypothetical protein